MYNYYVNNGEVIINMAAEQLTQTQNFDVTAFEADLLLSGDMRTLEVQERDALDYAVRGALELTPDQNLLGWNAEIGDVTDRTGTGITHEVILSGLVGGQGLPDGHNEAVKRTRLNHVETHPTLSDTQRAAIGNLALGRDKAAAQRAYDLAPWGPDPFNSHRSHRAILVAPDAPTPRTYWAETTSLEQYGTF